MTLIRQTGGTMPGVRRIDKMKFAIVSDTHDNWANFKKVIDFLNAQHIATILHCGDVCNKEIMEEAVKSFKGKIVYVKGNGDYELANLPDILELDLGSKKVAMVHYPDLAKKLAESGKYDLVFYGHTHRPWEETLRLRSGQACRLVNPGEVAGQRYKPTFALYDTETDTLALKVLERI